MTDPTTLPTIEDIQQAKEDIDDIHEFTTSAAVNFVDSEGNTRKTIAGFQADANAALTGLGWVVVDSFSVGATITSRNQALRYPTTGELYRWDGTLPKVVAPGSTPASSGGTGVGAWLLVSSVSSSQVDAIFSKATLDLDFAKNNLRVYEPFGLTGKVLTDAVTTVRATTATYDTPVGLASAVNDIPRIEYNTVTGQCLGLLAEESRTNLLLRSREFDNTSWVKQAGATITPNTTMAPDGTLTADTLTTNNGVSVHQSATATIGTRYCQSVYIKAGTITRVMIRDDTGAGRHIVINPATGAVTSTSGTIIAHGVDAQPNGWYRAWFSYTADTTVVRMNIRSDAENAATVVLWGAQIEVGSFPTSYIPTTTAQITRVADGYHRSLPTLNEGTVFVDCIGDAPVSGVNQVAAYISDGTINNRVVIRRNNSTNGTSVLVISGGSVVYNPSTTQKAKGVRLRMAVSFRAGNFVVCEAGAIVASQASGAMPIGMNTIGIGNIGTPSLGGESLSGMVARVAIFPRALTNAELQAITA